MHNLFAEAGCAGPTLKAIRKGQVPSVNLNAEKSGRCASG